MKHNTYIFIMLLLITSIIKAQETVPISEANVLERVSKENLSIKISEQEFVKARADYRQTNAVFLPNITASHTVIATTNPLMAFGSKLNQEILTQTDFDPSLLNNPSQIENYATKIEIQQPLINVDGIYQRKAAKSKMAAMSVQTQRTNDFLMFEVNKAYMQLQLAYKGVDVLEVALKTANENKKLADNSYKQGYLQRADVLSVEVRVTEIKNQLQTAKSNVEDASNYLSFLMNTNTNTILKPTDSLTVSNVNLYTNKSITENRSDIKAMQLTLDAYEAMNKADKLAFLPRLNAFGSYEFYDDKIFQGNANGYLFGAQLSWTILEGSKRFGKTQKSKAEYEKSKINLEHYKAQSQVELNNVRRMLNDAKNNLELSKLALEQSQESFRIRTNRFKEGLEKTSDLLVAETQYQQKQLEYYATIYQHNYALAYYQYLTEKL